jgi:hypothetical protein
MGFSFDYHACFCVYGGIQDSDDLTVLEKDILTELEQAEPALIDG